MTTYKPGSFFLARISGATGYAIALGQALAGDASRWSHAGIVLNESGAILEAEPGGARISHLSEYAGRPLLISDGPVQRWLDDSSGTAAVANEQWMRDNITRQARKLVGVPYSAVDYLALTLLHLHLPSSWIRRRVASSGHLICSALVDRVYANAGVHLFNDGRLSGDVLPADLAAWAEDWTATS